MYTCIHIYIYVYVCTCMCVYRSSYLYIYRYLHIERSVYTYMHCCCIKEPYLVAKEPYKARQRDLCKVQKSPTMSTKEHYDHCKKAQR